jgi:hypothetical protein
MATTKGTVNQAGVEIVTQSARRGRPPGSRIPPERKRKPRTMRLTDERWAQLQALGPLWLEKAITTAFTNPGATA